MSTIKAIVVHADGLIRRVDVRGYDGLVELVGGYIEHLPFGDGSAWINENGKADGLPFNKAATDLCRKFKVGIATDDFIVGNMVVTGPADEEGEDTDVTEKMARKIFSSPDR